MFGCETDVGRRAAVRVAADEINILARDKAAPPAGAATSLLTALDTTAIRGKTCRSQRRSLDPGLPMI